ncbi:type III-A CRISPR-associated RAMP protein Csm3 [Anaerobranca gottschalkii]|uniref:CRISPR system Cms endoribonuclease Csm3 n=1 Tax=Anaerobranca gottschalkii DSM 13577 TaxID=1120990 RepID=A0A1I0A996_9FIRM|nr:type III-A CRISPR-associated RAMP protein Csm3 [Anaerobranca gottschalkii]SES90723.1 CRISPR-associated protein Csm3 [Anaerobranca gottschalkii DSM 13577]
MQLKGKLFVKGKIVAMTGLHIGGSKTDVAIGDIDNSVIKTSEGVPYIPGSSLKGKIRALLEKTKLQEIMDIKKEEKEEKEENSDDNSKETYICNCGECEVCVIFGTGANVDKRKGPTRLIVRDAFLNEKTREKMLKKEGEYKNLQLIYTESKWENSINRLTSKAGMPRQTERVPQGAEFDFQLIYNVMENEDIDRFEKLIYGLRLLEDDYLGGNGSRGYGKVQFIIDEISIKTIPVYLENKETISLLDKDKGQITLNEVPNISDKIKEVLGEM